MLKLNGNIATLGDIAFDHCVTLNDARALAESLEHVVCRALRRRRDRAYHKQQRAARAAAKARPAIILSTGRAVRPIK